MSPLLAAKNALRGIATLVAIDKRSTTPLYRQICDSCRERILSAELGADQLLPSSLRSSPIHAAVRVHAVKKTSALPCRLQTSIAWRITRGHCSCQTL